MTPTSLPRKYRHMQYHLKRLWRVALAACLSAAILSFTPALAGSAVRAGPLDSAIGQAQEALRGFVESSTIPGLSVAVAVDGRIVWAEGFGFADLEQRVSARADTVYRIASISKSMTGAVLARLALSGRLDLDAPIRQLVPEFPEKPEGEITARYLAAHLSGIPHYANDAEKLSAVHYDSLAEAIGIFAEKPLLFEPGTSLSYTTYGYTLLGLVMERAAGTPFPELMQTELLDPLGMHDTIPDDPQAVVLNRSATYAYDEDRGVVHAPATDHSNKLPGGGFLSTAVDIVTLGAALAQPDYLDAATVELMLAPARLKDGRETNYAMGWNIKTDPEGRRLYGHGGNQPGGRGYVLVYPDANVSIAMLCNMYMAPLGRAEAMIIAEPFVEYVEGVATRPAAFEPSGAYVLTAFDEKLDRELTATVEIRQRFRKWTGSLAFFNERFDLHSIHVDGRSVRGIGFDGKRMTLMECDVAEDGTISGTIRNGSKTRTFTGQYTPFPTGPG